MDRFSPPSSALGKSDFSHISTKYETNVGIEAF